MNEKIGEESAQIVVLRPSLAQRLREVVIDALKNPFYTHQATTSTTDGKESRLWGMRKPSGGIQVHAPGSKDTLEFENPDDAEAYALNIMKLARTFRR